MSKADDEHKELREAYLWRMFMAGLYHVDREVWTRLKDNGCSAEADAVAAMNKVTFFEKPAKKPKLLKFTAADVTMKCTCSGPMSCSVCSPMRGKSDVHKR